MLSPSRSIIGVCLLFLATYAHGQDLQWAKRIGGSGNDFATGHHMDGSGNHILAGYFSGTVDFDPGPGTTSLSSRSTDSFIAKYSASGDFMWVRHISGSFHEVVRHSYQDNAGNILLTGHFYNTCDFDPGPDTVELTSVGLADFFVAKYDPSGNLLWVRAGGGPGVGGRSEDATAVTADAQGNVIACGTFEGTAIFRSPSNDDTLVTNGNRDLFVAKYLADGSLAWIHGFGSDDAESPGGVTAFPNGDVGLTGYFRNQTDFHPGTGPQDTLILKANHITGFLARYSATGSLVWAKRIINPDSGQVITEDVLVDGQGGLILTGNFTRTADFDPGPGTSLLTSEGQGDVFLARYTGAGALDWVKHMPGGSFDGVTDLELAPGGGYLMAGSFSDDIDLDPGPGTRSYTTAGSSDAFFARYSPTGDLIWAMALGGTDREGATGVQQGPQGQITVSGFFTGTVDFDPGPGTTSLRSAGNSDQFLVAFADPTALRLHAPLGLSVWPNPASSHLKVRLEKAAPKGVVSIWTLSGQRKSIAAVSARETELDLGHLPAGLYMLEVQTPEGRQTVPFSLVR